MMAERMDGGPSPPFPWFLPPEVKVCIAEFLPIGDLKALRQVDRAWSCAATTGLETKGILTLTPDSVTQILEEAGSFGTRFKSFRLEAPLATQPLADFQERVILALTSRVAGGGCAVEKLTFAKEWGSPEKFSALLSQVFTICPNVKEIRRTFGCNWFCPNVLQQSLPVLVHCKTLCWDHFEGLPAESFMKATPNLETLVDPWKYILDSLKGSNRWPYLRAVKFNNRYTSFISQFRRLLKVLTFSALNFSSSCALPLMEQFSETLEVLEMNDCSYGDMDDWTPFSALRPPTMATLRTLSILNFDPDNLTFFGVGFIFGSVFNPTPQSMKLETNFPALETLRFTVKKGSMTKPCIFILNYLPFLLEGGDSPSIPNIKTLELEWPDRQKDSQLWKDWTGRIVAKFPNVEGNPHVNKWKAIGGNELAGGCGSDRVEEAWGNYRRVHEAKRRLPQCQRPLKQVKYWR